MSTKKYKPEQVVNLLRQIEVEIANGKTTPQACRDAGITAQTYYRWRKEFGGLKLDQAKCLKELEKENSKLKRLVPELSLEKQVLKDNAVYRARKSVGERLLRKLQWEAAGRMPERRDLLLVEGGTNRNREVAGEAHHKTAAFGTRLQAACPPRPVAPG